MKRYLLETTILMAVLVGWIVVLSRSAVAAATPASPSSAPAAPAPTRSQAAAMAKLKELKSMQKQGLITEAQYQAESQKIVNQLVE